VSAFSAEARRAFAFLERDFGARVHRSSDRRGGVVEWRNHAAFVRVAHDGDLTVDLGTLEGGAAGAAIPLEALLAARGAEPPPAGDVAAWAAALHRHAGPVLDGDARPLEGLAPRPASASRRRWRARR
jgi:hypothetical protein